MISRSFCKITVSLALLIIIYNSVSSAYWGSEDLTKFGNSDVNKLNNTGPITEPCGTPDVTGTQSDLAPEKITRCLRLERKLLIHIHMLLQMPYLCSFCNRIEWSTRSKALDQSRKIASTLAGFAASKALVHVSKRVVNWVIQECLGWKPCWESGIILYSAECWMSLLDTKPSSILQGTEQREIGR